MRPLVPGIALTAGVSALLVWLFGWEALLPGLLFGGIATVIQWAASGMLRRAAGKPFEQLLKALGAGMGLRVLGMFLFLGAVLADPALFPPLPTAIAFVGVLIPLMFSDLRTIR